MHLQPELLTVAICFGSHGTAQILHIVKRLQDGAMPLQIIALCGKNRRVAQQLRALPQASGAGSRLLVVEFTTEVRSYLELADIFIGKPGSMLFQALQLQVAVICELNRHTMRQERGNAEMVSRLGLGVTVDNFQHIAAAVAQLGANLNAYRQRIAAFENRAVFEARDALLQIMQ